MLQQHGVLLEEVRRRYGVQPHYLVAFWAIESNYGRATGGFSVVEALATLAYDPRRADFFREQLLTALQIIDDGHIQAERMSGSWAGAMGQLQFMPNIFYWYALTEMQTEGSISGTAYLTSFTCRQFFIGIRLARRRAMGQGSDAARRFRLQSDRNSNPHVTGQVAVSGLTLVNGNPLPVVSGMEASVILLAGAQGPAFLGYQNFRTTMTYNPSAFYALTVGHLADRFIGGEAIARMPENEQAMSLADVKQLQELLNSRGFASGEPMAESDAKPGLRSGRIKKHKGCLKTDTPRESCLSP